MISQMLYEAFWLLYAFRDTDEGTWNWTQIKGQKRGYDEMTIMGVLFFPYSIYFGNRALDGGREEIHCFLWAGRHCRHSKVGCSYEELANILSFVVIIILWVFFLFLKNSRRRRILKATVRRDRSDYSSVVGSCSVWLMLFSTLTSLSGGSKDISK